MPDDALRIPSDARSYALGNLSLNGQPSASAMYYNPASLRFFYGNIEQYTRKDVRNTCADTSNLYTIIERNSLFSVGFNRWIFDNNLFSLYHGGTLSKSMTYGLSFGYIGKPAIDNFNERSEDWFIGDEAISESRFTGGLGIGKSFGSKNQHSLGLSLSTLIDAPGGDLDATSTLFASFGWLYNTRSLALGVSSSGMSIRMTGPKASQDGFDEFIPQTVHGNVWLHPVRLFGDPAGFKIKIGAGAGLSAYNEFSDYSSNAGLLARFERADGSNALSFYWGIPELDGTDFYGVAYPRFSRLGLGFDVGRIHIDLAYDGAFGQRPDGNSATGIMSLSLVPQSKTDTTITLITRSRMTPRCTKNCPECKDGLKVMLLKGPLALEEFYALLGKRISDSEFLNYISTHNPHITEWGCIDSGQTICVPCGSNPFSQWIIVSPGEPSTASLEKCKSPDCRVHVVNRDCDDMNRIIGRRDPEIVRSMNPHIACWDCLPRGQEILLYADSCSEGIYASGYPLYISLSEGTDPSKPLNCKDITLDVTIPCTDRRIDILVKSPLTFRTIDSLSERQMDKKKSYVIKNLCTKDPDSDTLIILIRESGEIKDSFNIVYDGLTDFGRYMRGDQGAIDRLKEEKVPGAAIVFVQDRSHSTGRKTGDMKAFAVMDSAILTITNEVKNSDDFEPGKLYFGLYEFGQATGYDASRVKDVCDISQAKFCDDFRRVIPLSDVFISISAFEDSVRADLNYKRARGCSPILSVLDKVLEDDEFSKLPKNFNGKKVVVLISDGYEWCHAQPWGRVRVKPKSVLSAWADTAITEFNRIVDEFSHKGISFYVLSSGVKDKYAPYIFDDFKKERPAAFVQGSSSNIDAQAGFLRRTLGGAMLFDEGKYSGISLELTVTEVIRKNDSLSFYVNVNNLTGGHFFADRISYIITPRDRSRFTTDTKRNQTLQPP
jgi:hypothetical protein